MTFKTFGELYGATYTRCKCNLCGGSFNEADILIEDGSEKEYCPLCFTPGYIQSEGDSVGEHCEER